MSKNATFSMIGADVVITGDISASADLHIDCQVRGDVSCLALVQGAASEMVGTIVAQSARCAAASSSTASSSSAARISSATRITRR